MRKKTLCGLVFASALLFGGLFTGFNHVQQKEELVEVDAWTGTQKPNVGEEYYKTCEGLTGSNLKAALAAFNKPTNKSYDWNRYEAADEAQDDSTSIISIYTRHNIKKTSHCGNYAWDKWNREHVFTQSAFPNSADDNHNIFACEGQINGYRGNKIFAEGGTTVVVFDHQTGCKQTGSTFEPCDEAKGEIARACMYVATYYPYKLADIFDSVDTCIKWHNEHPVTAREIFRNNTVYGLQKNRNPYVDHPSYANSVFGGNYTEPDPITGNVPDPDDPPVNPVVPTDAITVKQALEIIKKLGDKETTTDTYKVKGVISTKMAVTKSTKYENTYQYYVADQEGDAEQLFVYWLSCDVTPKQGDKVEMVGKLQNYVDNSGNHKYEILDGTATIVNESGGTDPINPDPDPEPTPYSPEKKKGCGGSIIASSVLISSTSLIGLAFLISKKKRK